MVSILLVAHAPLASSMLAVGGHAFGDCGRALVAVDIPSDASLDSAEAQIRAAIETLPEDEVLILTDAFGATPCNAALAAADGQHCRVVTGVNVPMLWRALCYAKLPLAELVARAADGGRQGIMQATATAPQNQPNRPCTHDPDAHPDQ